MDTKLLSSIFETMDYSKCEIVDKNYQDWCSQHSSTFAAISESNEDFSKYLQLAKSVTRKAPWNDPTKRATLLFKLAQAVEKKKDLFACVEADSAQKSINRTKARDIPELVQHLYSASHQVASCPMSWEPCGVVGVIVDITNSPSLCQTWDLGPALSAGNAIVLAVAPENCKTACLLTSTAKEVGFPEGVLGVTCINHASLVDDFDLILASGDMPVCNLHPKSRWQPVTRPKAIVTDSADIASAVHGVIQLLDFNSPTSSESGAFVLVQENIYDNFWVELSNRFSKLHCGSSAFDRTGDFFLTENEQQKRKREEFITAATENGAQLCFPSNSENVCFPVLVRGINPTALFGKTGSCGQILHLQSFRHYKEAVTLANAAPFTDFVSIWGEQTSVVLEMAKDLRPRTVWINTQNIVDVAGFYGIYDFLSAPKLKKANSETVAPRFEAKQECNGTELSLLLKKAVSQARSAYKKWNDIGADSQAKLLFSLAGKVQSLDSSFSSEDCTQCANLLYKYASQAVIPNFGSKSENASSAKCWTWVSAIGVIGADLPPTGTFPALVSAMGAALAAGNTFVALVPDQKLVSKFSELVTSSGLPSGTVNLLFSTNCSNYLLTVDIDAAWLLNSSTHQELPQRGTDNRQGLAVSSLDLSEYNWKENVSNQALGDWFQRQAITVKKVWLESGY